MWGGIFSVIHTVIVNNWSLLGVFFLLTGMLLRYFVNFYDMEIIEEEAFLAWKEDITQEFPGKGKALFQVLIVRARYDTVARFYLTSRLNVRRPQKTFRMGTFLYEYVSSVSSLKWGFIVRFQFP